MTDSSSWLYQYSGRTSEPEADTTFVNAEFDRVDERGSIADPQETLVVVIHEKALKARVVLGKTYSRAEVLAFHGM